MHSHVSFECVSLIYSEKIHFYWDPKRRVKTLFFSYTDTKSNIFKKLKMADHMKTNVFSMSQFIPFLSVVVVCLCLSFTCCCGFWVAYRFFRKKESNQTPPRIQETTFSPRRDSRTEEPLFNCWYHFFKIKKLKFGPILTVSII